MSLIIADRVKETTTTQGTGTITLSGSTFGGFQSFSSAIGEGNTTYYCIQNEGNFEIGVGTYSSSTLSRDTVFSSSNSDNRISIVGAAVVFCVVPSEKLLYKDESNNTLFPTPTAFKRSDSGDYWQAFSTDVPSRVVSFYITESTDAQWKIGLKTSSTDTVEPSYGYITAKEGFVEVKGSALSYLNIGQENDEGLKVSHNLTDIVHLRKNGGEITVETLSLDSTNSTKIKNTSIGNPVLEVESAISHASDLQTWNVATTEKASINQYGDFQTVGNIISPSGKFSSVRFSDLTIQTTAGLPFISGQLIDQNKADIATVSGLLSDDSSVSGYFESRVDSLDVDIATVSGLLYNDASLSGYFESRVDSADSSIIANSGYFESRVGTNAADIATVSGLLYDDAAISGYLESRVDVADSSIAANSGYFESRANAVDSNLSTVSGLLTPSGESFDFSANILTYNNSNGGSFTADLSSLSTFDTSGVSLGYSAGTLTYTNNAGGTFSTDISSISGDVYAMIVDGAPSTLDTLNEIAAALNDDENIATTLTSLISTTSGNLQSQIISNDTDIATNVASINTVSGLLYDDAAISGYFESRVDQADSDILTVSGLLYNDAAVSGYFESRADSADSDIATVSGLLYSDASLSGYFENRVDSNETNIATNVVSINTVSGLLYDDSAVSGYFESRVDSAESDIATVSGLLYNDASLSGYFEGRADSNETNIATNTANITTVSGLLYNDSAISGYFESRSDESDANNSTVSGLLYNYWTVSDGVNSENILANQQVTFSGVDGTDVSYDVSSNTVAISGGGGGAGSSTGIPSGVGFFDDSGSISGNNTFIYDGQDIKVSGAIFSSGERAITSDEIFHIKQLTQSEYDAITPSSATFYIITDPDIEGPVVQPIKTVSSDYTILTTDYTIHTTAGLTLTLPSAAGNGGIMYNVKNVSTGAVVVSGVGGNTIDGQPSFNISTQYQSVSLQSTNSNWIIV